jgi:xanthine dehydrogenase small subunit
LIIDQVGGRRLIGAYSVDSLPGRVWRNLAQGVKRVRLMRDQVLLCINGRRHLVSQRLALLSLSDYLRHELGLVGTKIVCSEGDCGACTVLVGRPREGRLRYHSVDSCIQFMFQLDGTHVVTVEGLSPGGRLNAVQQAMVECHGSQCGFCTPGFVVAMTGMLEDCGRLAEADMRYGLTGNLCRCTGYTPIMDAGLRLDADTHLRLEEMYPSAAMLAEFAKTAEDNLELSAICEQRQHLLFSPTDVGSAVDFLGTHPEATIIAGATDVGVRINKSHILPETILDLNRLAELEEVSVANDRLVLGARASWTAIEGLCQRLVPQFHEIVSIFGSPQIRNVGTIGGNIVNASPIADSLPFLFVMEAELELKSSAGTRRVDINDFYRAYKQLDLKPGELLTRVLVPLPEEDEILRLYKVTRRRDLDISSFTAAIRMRVDRHMISEAKIAYGAVGPTILRARRTEEFLGGQPFNEETMRQAGDIAVDEVTPISDVRGSADYRYQLTRNVLLKFYHQQQPAILVA